MAGISQVEAARKYGVSQSQISRWVKQGLIRVLRPGRRGRPYELAEEDVARPGGHLPRRGRPLPPRLQRQAHAPSPAATDAAGGAGGTVSARPSKGRLRASADDAGEALIVYPHMHLLTCICTLLYN
jgi:hypothetical protein